MYYLISAATIIINTLFSAYIVILLLRFMLQKLRASWHNPLSKLLYTLTEIPLKLFRKIIPGYRGFDFSIIFFALLLQCIQTILLLALQLDMMPNMAGVLVIAIANLFSKFIYIYIYAVIINVVLSWLPELRMNPVAQIVYLIVEPILSYTRRFIPLIAGIDISPILILLCLTLINRMLINEIVIIGTRIVLN